MIDLQPENGVLGAEHHVKELAIVDRFCVSFVDLFDHLLAFQMSLWLADLLQHLFQFHEI